jgi:hypothetical protein
VGTPPDAFASVGFAHPTTLVQRFSLPETGFHYDGRGEFRMAQQQSAPKSEDLAETEQKARIDKLRLEISALEKPSSGYKPLLDAVPLITIAITLATLWAGAYKYFDDRKEARLAQERAQIRTDIDQILSFPTDTKISLARVTFLLHDLGDLTASDSSRRDNVTDVIDELIKNDLDFDKIRDAGFSLLALTNWAGYAARLRDKGGSMDLRYKYYQALRHLYEANKPYFSSIGYDRETGGYVVKEYTEEAQFILFAALVGGYGKHIEFIKNDSERKEAIERFADALHNPGLAAALFDGRH